MSVPRRSRASRRPSRSVRRLLLFLAAAVPFWLWAGEPLGFLVPGPVDAKLGPEANAAWELAAKLQQPAERVALTAEATFADATGKAAALDRFVVLWYHQGDSPELVPPLTDPGTVEALRNYVASGHGLFLSGAALALVYHLRLDPAVPRLGGPGVDNVLAGLVPVVADHPVFRGLTPAGGGLIPVNDGGYPAFSDFHGSDGPAGGMLLGRTGGGVENPLVEYQLGKGRVLVLGWRLPHYSRRENAHRANLERLTANALAYLADPQAWRQVVVPPPARRGKPAWLPPLPEQLRSLELAVRDLLATFGDRYPKGAEFLADLADIQRAYAAATVAGDKPDATVATVLADLADRTDDLRRRALLGNPLLDFDRLLVVKRSLASPRLGLPQNWESNSSLPVTGYDNQIAVLSPLTPSGALTAVYQPDGRRFVGDVDLHWSAERLLFSMPDAAGRWQVFEVHTDGAGLRQLALIDQSDVNNYDACYLPNGNILFTSTAAFAGVPCVTGASHVANLYLLDQARASIRRLTFDQDHDWCPTVLNDGRVLYLRWEYSDLPHFVSRILFQMNPDGTGQAEYYGSNSYWPNALFYARPAPNHPTRFFAIVGGHHDVPRQGELVLFDAAHGRAEGDGVVQRLPGRGRKVEPIIQDGLVSASWPKFLHPWPLSDKYVVVSAKPSPNAAWGIYLVDVFDNLVLLHEEPWYALFEPIPLRRTPVPPLVPDRVDPGSTEAEVHLADVYAGPGLQGVPRGTVKKLRLFTYHFAYQGMGGQGNRIGLDGPWDIKRVLGTVPVQADGSARFRVPANTPVSVQPLDGDGRALQLMRSWFTGMPGEVLSCVGCHERRNTGLPTQRALAGAQPPSAIEPWYGPTRGFSFQREVQPVLDRYCVGCHHGGTPTAAPATPGPAPGRTMPDFRARPPVQTHGASFTPAYFALRCFVRAPTMESDMHLLGPGEYHASTTRLVRLLDRGHHGVRLEAEAWDRLVTWIDLNTPAHGTWHEIVGEARTNPQRDRRQAMDRQYANLDVDPEAIYPAPAWKPETVPPAAVAPAVAPRPALPAPPHLAGWPLTATAAKARQAADGPTERRLDLGAGVTLDLVRLPAGEFPLGDDAGEADEQPVSVVTVAPVWIGRTEVTNEQYARFDPGHDSGLETGDFLQFSNQERGYPLNGASQPVCRVSWYQARAFCRWLSETTGRRVNLPTEAQWEYACRAGTATPLWYGPIEADFAESANLADQTLRQVDTFGWGLPSGAIPPWRPAIESVNDGFKVSAPVGSFAPNAWGLVDLHGNVAEWTRSAYRPYPYREDDGRNADEPSPAPRVVRGGSWYDRPVDCRASARARYVPWQRVYDVGFRVVVE